MPLVKVNDVGPCHGVRGLICNDKSLLRIKGFDDKWRCRPCHKVHIELVYSETKTPYHWGWERMEQSS